jgi:ribosomal protein S18 acetylase RimI-like enzyme
LIRLASEDDWPRIWPIWHRIAVAGDTIAWDPATSYEQARAEWLGPSAGDVFVVTDGDAVVGSAQLHPNYGPASRVANATFIVDPDRSGQGIGRRLVQHVLDAARAGGYRSMVFNAVVETNVYAIRLYTSLGFTTLATVPEAFDHPAHGPVGLHIMYLNLSPVDSVRT